jgi:methyl-accepting chemotaxis protein
MTTKTEEEQLIQKLDLARRGQFALTITRVVMWAAVIMAGSVAALWWFFPQYKQMVGSAVLLALLAVGSGSYQAFYRRGQIVRGVKVFLYSLIAVVAIMPLLLSPFIQSNGISFGMIVLMSALLLGGKDSLVLSLFCVFAFVADTTLTQYVTVNWFTPLDARADFVIGAFAATFVLGASVAVVYQIITGQEQLFRNLQQMTWEVEKRAQAEQQKREHLQSTIAQYVEHMALVGRGNLIARITLDGHGRETDDPLIMLGIQLNETTANLQRMIVQVRDAANNLGSAAAEILAATTQQVSGASEQSAAISQTTTTVDEVKTIAEQASARAQEVADASQRTVQVSRSGQRAVQDTIESMGQIKERVEGIAENILSLSEQTQQIGEIITTVNDLAAQSNILALNASVEAARAGEHGKGFAVVAVEVRNLAEQSKQATAQVKAILSEIQKATNATVMATEEGTKKVDAGVQLAAQARQSIEQLSGVINESAQAAMQMVAGGRQQATGIEQIALAMRNINQATVQSLSSTRQAEKSAQSLNELARSLSQTVAQYQL